jgi:hypothetical protein
MSLGHPEYEVTEIEENISALYAAVFYYPIQNGLPLVSILSQMKTIHTLTS